jgi:two-component system, OmpR family, phosphate regulon sensor histidine kinase PhoR
MKYIFSKIFGGYLIAIILLTGSILIFTFQSLREHYLSSLEKELYSLNYALEPAITPLLLNKNYSTLDSLVKAQGKKTKTRVTIIATDGEVLADSEKDPKTMENHKYRPEVIAAGDAKNGKSLRYSTTVNESMLYVAVKLVNQNETLGYSRISFFIRDINLILDSLMDRILNIALIVIVISIFVIWIFSRSLTNPIKQLAEAARKVAEGDFDTKVYLKNKDELKNLADSFNYMTEQIKSLFDQISLQKEVLDGIISSIKDGFLVLNFEGKILLNNAGFSHIVKNDENEGKYYWEVLEDPHFSKFVKSIQIEKTSIVRQVEIGNSVFLCSANYLEAQQEILIIMYDITKVKQLETIKKDFVMNVSHELRTPLTAIKGFIETILDSIGGKNKKYLKIINRHTDRLINIVNDLLLLSKLEDTASKLIPKKVKLNKLVGYVLTIFTQKLTDNNLTVEFKIDDDFPQIEADPFKLEQLFVNLIDNAIRFTENGKITIAIEEVADKVKIIFSDTGFGIPKDQLPRIFERFYTVDKSRSRKLGGTGLGLAIVKHIVGLHNGEITVDSEPGKGTTFIILIPKEQVNSNEIA